MTAFSNASEQSVSPYERSRPVDFHTDHTHAPPRCLGKHGLYERKPVDVGSIQSNQDGVEVESSHRLQQDGWIVVARDSQKTNATLVTSLDECLDGPAFGEDNVEITHRSQIMKLPQIKMVRAQPPQTILQQPQRPVASPVVRLGSQKDFTAPLAQCRPVVIHAAFISRCGIAVVDAVIERTMDNAYRLLHPAVRAKHAFATKSKERHFVAGIAERACW